MNIIQEKSSEDNDLKVLLRKENRRKYPFQSKNSPLLVIFKFVQPVSTYYLNNFSLAWRMFKTSYFAAKRVNSL